MGHFTWQHAVDQLRHRNHHTYHGYDLAGKTAIVTGANSGIGLEAAKHLVEHGASHVILAVRNTGAGETAKFNIQKTNPECKIEVWELDLESFSSITAFAKRTESLNRLDIVILNAGVKQIKYHKSTSGHELNLQVNHLGTALLSLLLMPKLRNTAKNVGSPSRMTFTTSESHFWTPFNERHAPNILARMDEESSFKEVDDGVEHDQGGMERYSTSKLLNLLWYRELSLLVPEEEIIINGSCPGFVASALHRHETSVTYKLAIETLAYSPKEGAHGLLDAALVKGKESHGGYCQRQKLQQPSGFVLSEEGKKAQKQVWKETINLLKKEAPEADLGEFATVNPV